MLFVLPCSPSPALCQGHSTNILDADNELWTTICDVLALILLMLLNSVLFLSSPQEGSPHTVLLQTRDPYKGDTPNWKVLFGSDRLQVGNKGFGEKLISLQGSQRLTKTLYTPTPSQLKP